MYSAKLIVVSALMASASAFCPAPAFRASSALMGEKANWDKAAELGWSMGGEDHTRNPDPVQSDDPRKSIPQAQSFEEYMKMRQQQGN